MKVTSERMKYLMRINGITGEKLAKLLNVSSSFVSMAIAGKRRFNMAQSQKLIRLFGADIFANAIDWEGMHVSRSI